MRPARSWQGQRSWETPEGDQRSVTEIEADEVGASLKWATAKVERTNQRGNGDRTQGRERQAERGGDFNDPPPFYILKRTEVAGYSNPAWPAQTPSG